jgi:hypothetical protein
MPRRVVDRVCPLRRGFGSSYGRLAGKCVEHLVAITESLGRIFLQGSTNDGS